MKNVSRFYRGPKRRFKVLVIEDEKDALKCVERSLPENCDIISPEDCDIISKDGHKISKDEYITLCKNGLEGSFNGITFKEYFKRLLEENSTDIRVIVCDLRLGDDVGGGAKIISWIRDTKTNGINLPADYLQYIPIIGYTSATNSKEAERIQAVAAMANVCLVKDTVAISSKEKKDIVLTGHIAQYLEYFQCLYEFLIYRKTFKVALSFTGRNNTILHREFVEEIAHHLYSCYTKKRVFYDVDMLDSGYTVGMTKDEFTELYNKECEYIIVLVSEDYATEDNPWTQYEWVGIHDYYNKYTKKVVFVAIEKNVNEAKFMNHLGMENIGIWINASDLREEFYKRMCGKGLEQKAVVNEMSVYDATIKDYTEICYKNYKEICEKIYEKIVRPIVNHISSVDEGKK